jgi:methyl-accepting chemotaxis protein
MTKNSKEYVLTSTDLLVSRTDLNGNIIFVNEDFVRISGYSREELIGQPHNIVRHPDMPKAAFADLWHTLKAGQPWTGIVKNQCKDGKFYWVSANVSPFYENSQIAGYISVRNAPSPALIKAAESVYAIFNSNTHPKIKLDAGNVIENTLISKLNLLKQASIKMLFLSNSLLSVAMFLFIAFTVTLESWLLQSAIALGIFANVVAMRLTVVKIINPLDRALNYLIKMSQGNYRDEISIKNRSEISSILMAIKTLQIQLNFREHELKVSNKENLRFKIAFDNMNAAVMIADEKRTIIYANNTVLKLLQNAEKSIQQELPEFAVKTMLGKSIDIFHKNPAHQRQLLEQFTSTAQATTVLGGKYLSICVDPIISSHGQRLGSVTVWRDRTDEVASEIEIENVLLLAKEGDFSGRIHTHGLEGFYLQASDLINELMKTTEQAVNDILELSEALEEGNLTATIHREYAGSFGLMKTGLNATIENLSSLINEVKITSEMIASASQEISAGNHDLSRRTEAQAASVEQTAASMEQLAATVLANTDNAKRANALAVDASNTALKGVEVVNNVVSTMTSINESSHRIIDIITVIDDIAFQTNILALNAAVEAARAGEQGKGFAVVAVEVRNLAQRAANAAGEIKLLISESAERVNSGSKQVTHAGKTMEDIVEAIKEVTILVSGITTASIEQNLGIDQVHDAMIQMDSVTQQNAALVEEMAAAAESLSQQTISLAREISHFKTDTVTNNLNSYFL